MTEKEKDPLDGMVPGGMPHAIHLLAEGKCILIAKNKDGGPCMFTGNELPIHEAIGLVEWARIYVRCTAIESRSANREKEKEGGVTL